MSILAAGLLFLAPAIQAQDCCASVRRLECIETQGLTFPSKVARPITRRSGSSKGSLLNRAVVMVLDMAVVTPIPTARIKIATTVHSAWLSIRR
jgi:hypothetical protein